MSKRDNLSPLFAWRMAVFSEHGPHSTTRVVLSALSLHMRSEGGGAFPSIRLLAKECGLTERSVCTHLARAEEDGWIVITKRPAQQWVRHEYRATIPQSVAEAMDFTAQRDALYSRPDFSRPERKDIQQSPVERRSTEGVKPITHSLHAREEGQTPAERVMLQEGLREDLLHDKAKGQLQQLVDEGATLEDIRKAARHARENKASWGVAYIVPKVMDAISKRRREQNQAETGGGAWWTSYSQTCEKGAERGLFQRDDEIDRDFVMRVRAAFGITA